MALVSYNLVKMLRKNGYLIDYLSYPNVDNKKNNDDFINYFQTSPKEPFNKIKVIIESLEFIKRYDIIHAHSIFSIPLFFSKKPYILHFHGTDIRQYAHNKDILGYLMKKTIKKANIILVSTPDLLKEVSFFNKRSIFLPNPVNFDIFRPYQSSIDLHDGCDFVIFHPSRHCSIKRNDILIKAFQKIIEQKYNAKLVMVELDKYDESKKLINKLGIEKNVVWIKKIQYLNMAQYYNACDVVCDQFVIDGLCQVSLEAMACSKPVITKYNPTDILQVYRKSPPFSQYEQIHDIEDFIISLIQDERLKKKIGELSYNWVRYEHSEKRILKILNYCYSNFEIR